jgi:hypothetical protein
VGHILQSLLEKKMEIKKMEMKKKFEKRGGRG